MMSSHDKMHVILVQPPVVCPSLPPWMLAQVLSFLDDPGVAAEPYDANLDFFLNHLLTSKAAYRFVDLVNKKEKQGVFEQRVTDKASLLADSTTDLKKWRHTIANVVGALDVLRTERFFRPEDFVKTIRYVDTVLRLASLAYYPSHIRWSRFYNPEIEGWTQAAAFIDDAETNPFLPLCRDGLAPRLNNPHTRLLILCISAPDQLLAALTMARFSKHQHPQLHVALMGENELPAAAKVYVDTLLSAAGPNSVLKLVAKVSGKTLSKDTAGPDFSGLPLKDYLSPALVLPLGAFKNADSNTIHPPPVWADLTGSRLTADVAGFLSTDHRLKSDDIANQVPALIEKEPSFCLGLASLLNDTAGREVLAVARQRGVKIIQWCHPSGPVKSLSQLLWDASRAGIWNHVIVAENEAERLASELVKFMAANPNIAHSWVFRRSSRPPFVGSSEKLPESGAYSQVAELPGQPFWHMLHDPVYMLLYLNRYSTKELLRWRIRNKAPSFYVLGRDIVYYFVKPEELPPGYLDDICRMVEAGGSVDTALVRQNLERAFLIGYALEDGVIVGNSSLKRPRREYVEAVNQQSGLDLSNYLERGYTSVRPEYRGMGIGAKLLEGLTERVGDTKLFSIISSDNVAAQKMAQRNRTRQVATFYSEKLGKEVGVWMPEWMIEG